MLYVSATTTEKKPEFYKKLLDRAMGYVKKGVVAGFPRGVLNTPHYKNEDGSMGKSIIDVALSNNYGIGVPQRDFMTPASKRWEKFFDESLDQVRRELEADIINPEKFLKAMGQRGSDIISQEIIALDTPPNSPYTIAKKGSSNPLVNTRDMSRAATWQIREEKDR